MIEETQKSKNLRSEQGNKQGEAKKVEKGGKEQQAKKEGQASEKTAGEKLKETVETLQRVQADFENYKKRVEKEKQGFLKSACSAIILEILPAVDSFEIALKTNSNFEDFKKGMEMIYAQLVSILEKNGLKPIKAKGEKFDPYVHEALLQEESDSEKGVIIEEFQKGYMMNDSVLRHSKVKVSAGRNAKSGSAGGSGESGGKK